MKSVRKMLEFLSQQNVQSSREKTGQIRSPSDLNTNFSDFSEVRKNV